MRKPCFERAYCWDSVPEIQATRQAMPGERIREAIISKIAMDVACPPLFQEEPGKPTHSMEADPNRDVHLDNFDRAQAVLDQFGAKADMNRVSRDASSSNSSSSSDKSSADDSSDSE